MLQYNIALYETHSEVCIGKYSYGMFPTENCQKQGNALWPLLSNFVKENQAGAEFTGTFQFLVYADNVNFLKNSINTTDKNTKAPTDNSKELGLEAITE
jgi:hypothetical protein